MFALEAAFSYEWNQQDNLSNGDEIKLVWNIDNDSLEKYNLKLEASELSEKVEGLEEIESYDAFSEIEVNVSGISPNGTLSIDSSRAEVPLNYSADKTTGIKKGDVITIEAAAPMEGICLNIVHLMGCCLGKIPMSIQWKQWIVMLCRLQTYRRRQ